MFVNYKYSDEIWLLEFGCLGSKEEFGYRASVCCWGLFGFGNFVLVIPHKYLEPDDYSYKAAIKALASGHIRLNTIQYQRLAKSFKAQVYGTQMLNDCPQELWEKLDAQAIKEELGAVHVKLNGPRNWLLDGLGVKIQTVEPVIREFGGIRMRAIAEVEIGSSPDQTPYSEIQVNRGSVFFFDAGARVYELVNPSGKAYVMRGYCVGIDANLTEDSLMNLGDCLNLPEGCIYRSRILDEELVLDTSDHLVTVLQDDFENT